MSTELSTQTMALVCRELGVFNVTPDEAKAVQRAIAENSRFVVLGEHTIMLSDIVGIVSGERISKLKRERKGEWQCDYKQWHAKGEHCGHDGKHW